MAPSPLGIYSIVAIDKDHGGYGTKDGQWLLCVHVSDDPDLSGERSAGSIGDFEVYDTEEHAEARVTSLRSGDADTDDDAAPPDGLVINDSINVKRQNLHNITSLWSGLCTSAAVSTVVTRDVDRDDDAVPIFVYSNEDGGEHLYKLLKALPDSKLIFTSLWSQLNFLIARDHPSEKRRRDRTDRT